MLTPEHKSPKSFVLFDVSKGCFDLCRSSFSVLNAIWAEQSVPGCLFLAFQIVVYFNDSFSIGFVASPALRAALAVLCLVIAYFLFKPGGCLSFTFPDLLHFLSHRAIETILLRVVDCNACTSSSLRKNTTVYRDLSFGYRFDFQIDIQTITI